MCACVDGESVSVLRLRFSDEEVGVSPSFHYGNGSDQSFQEGDYTVTPSKINEDYLTYDPENDKNRFPLVILMQTNCEHSEPLAPYIP